MVNYINFKINRKDIVYDGKVKNTYKGLGVIRLKEVEIGEKLYVVFPMGRMNKGGEIRVATDEILNKTVSLDRNNEYKVIDFGRKYVGRKCIVLKEKDLKNILLREKDIIYDGEVKTSHNGQGIVHIHDNYLGSRSYVIFPKNIIETNEERFVIVNIDEILNKGIHPGNDHYSRVLLGREHIGSKCLVVLQEE